MARRSKAGPAAARPPLGASIEASGVHFAVWSDTASAIDVVLFAGDGDAETGRLRLAKDREGLHSGFLDGGAVGLRYGLRASGAYDPARGLWHDPSKLLVDPYAFRLDRPFAYDPRLSEFGADTGEFVPKAIVCDPLADPAPLDPPRFAPGGLVYELPVRPFTMRHPDIPETLRGTLAALAEPPVIAHLKKLRVSAVELMPVTAWVDERHLGPLGLTNGWGYNPVTFFALDPRLAPGGIADLRKVADTFHAEGIGLFLDVVFNHTGESDTGGPTLAFRGLANRVYYEHAAEDAGSLVNHTGCGNTVACNHPVMRRMIIEAMRHFVLAAGIDGFRFDLAPILGRLPDGFSRDAPLFAEIAEDPVLSTRIMIAEPWDIGPGGYRLGDFPAQFLEWNDRYRDDVRRFWRGDPHTLGALATRLSGSSDIFALHGRAETRSVNFIAAHDGFTLHDLVAYEEKHNEANGENNRDGHNENFSWNNGAEGASDDAAVGSGRESDLRALIATLFASRGTIMLTAGDEFARTQDGNNNAYAQDNDITFLDWQGRDRDLEDHTALWANLRARFAELGHAAFLTGEANGDASHRDIVWLRPDGEEMTVADWEDSDGGLLAAVMPFSEPGIETGRLAVLFNRTHEAAEFALPRDRRRGAWRRLDRSGESRQTLVEPRTVALFFQRGRVQ